MANEILLETLKKIKGLVRSGQLDDAYAGYQNLFRNSEFQSYGHEDQRQALKLMIYAKGVPSNATPPMIEAYREALKPLNSLVSTYSEPADYEMLGVCLVMLGDNESASATFRLGLGIERERNPQSDLCGTFLKRISLL